MRNVKDPADDGPEIEIIRRLRVNNGNHCNER